MLPQRVHQTGLLQPALLTSSLEAQEQFEQDVEGHEANRPIRVCHLAKFYPPAAGGIESHVRTLARAQAALGAEARVLCVNHLDYQGRDVTWERFASTPAIEEQDGPVRVTRMGRRACLARLEVCPGLLGVVSRVQRGEVDLLHLHVPNPTMLLGLTLVGVRRPLVITYHSDIIRQRVLRLALLPFQHTVFCRAARILSDSPPYAEGSSLLQRHADKVEVLPLGIDLRPYVRPSLRALEWARRLRAEHGDPLWLAVGRLVYYKGLGDAIRALAAVPGRLLVIGRGPLEDALRRTARDAGVAGRVVWWGHADEDELIGAYHAATALWFPSVARSEGFGLVQVEAMASGCPVINTAIPASGVSWVSRHEETGLTVPVGNSKELARAALRLLADPGLRQRLSEGARRRAAEHFNDQTMARRSLDCYRRVLHAAACAPRRRKSQ